MAEDQATLLKVPLISIFSCLAKLGLKRKNKMKQKKLKYSLWHPVYTHPGSCSNTQVMRIKETITKYKMA